MSAIKIYYNDSLWIVMWDHRPPGRFAPHDKICDILRAAIKSRISADMLSLRIWYSVIIHITYSLLHKCNFFQMLMQINRSNWGHLQEGALCPMLLYRKPSQLKIAKAIFAINKVKHFLPHIALRSLYLTLVQSHIIYGIRLWGNGNTKSWISCKNVTVLYG